MSKNLHFDFAPDVRPVSESPTFSAPYAKGSETSKAGAEAVKADLSRQCQELLELYVTHGPLTDHEAAQLLAWERTTVIPRRHTLMRRQQVEKLGTRENPDSGIQNDVYGLKYGWATVGA
jgi:hypothetical protein